ncbi:MAG TPA: hypothetical protein VMD05_00880 [Candidatus Nanoarchaeia archaeon]|nr:hypothetical protein [Candidatus Nanoarchaeia archaeon]
MPKSISLPNTIYEDLQAVTEELAAMAKKPISTSMAIYLLTAVYRAHVSETCARDAFRQKLAASDIMSPEEFEKEYDVTSPEKRSENRVNAGRKKK